MSQYRGFNRRQTPKVKDGKVQKKNNWANTHNYYNTPQYEPVVDKQNPGKGYRHVISKRDIQRFIGIIPDWPELSKGLNAIVLAPGRLYTAGYYTGHGTIHICAWDDDYWQAWTPRFFDEHKDVLQRLGVPYEEDKDGDVLCKFNEDTVRGWQLLHILLHELGHHHDRMTTNSQRRCSRGETYAEQYALAYERIVWDRYVEEFGMF
jgi:hypothetical protein